MTYQIVLTLPTKTYAELTDRFREAFDGQADITIVSEQRLATGIQVLYISFVHIAQVVSLVNTLSKYLSRDRWIEIEMFNGEKIRIDRRSSIDKIERERILYSLAGDSTTDAPMPEGNGAGKGNPKRRKNENS